MNSYFLFFSPPLTSCSRAVRSEHFNYIRCSIRGHWYLFGAKCFASIESTWSSISSKNRSILIKMKRNTVDQQEHTTHHTGWFTILQSTFDFLLNWNCSRSMKLNSLFVCLIGLCSVALFFSGSIRFVLVLFVVIFFTSNCLGCVIFAGLRVCNNHKTEQEMNWSRV